MKVQEWSKKDGGKGRPEKGGKERKDLSDLYHGLSYFDYATQ